MAVSGRHVSTGHHRGDGDTAPLPVTGPLPETPGPLEVRRAEAYRRLAALERDLADLCAGTGRWHHTPPGDAARQRNHAAELLNDAWRRANAPTAKRRDRRAAARSLDGFATALDQAERRWQEIGQPVADRLCRDITDTRNELEGIEHEALRRRLDTLYRGPVGRDLPGHGREPIDRLPGRHRGMGLGL
jgi:hypothetical protein